jgi:hypothetical protein
MLICTVRHYKERDARTGEMGQRQGRLACEKALTGDLKVSFTNHCMVSQAEGGKEANLLGICIVVSAWQYPSQRVTGAKDRVHGKVRQN